MLKALKTHLKAFQSEKRNIWMHICWNCGQTGWLFTTTDVRPICHLIETSQLICLTNHPTGFNVIEKLGFILLKFSLYIIRRVARNFWGQGRFLKIRAQINDSSERLNYMQTLLCTSLKNNYLYQILINLASILTRACNFMIKRIPWGFSIFTRKNKRCYVFLPMPYIGLHFLETIKQ